MHIEISHHSGAHIIGKNKGDSNIYSYPQAVHVQPISDLC